MRFERVIALIAVVGFVAQAHAQQILENPGSQVQVEVVEQSTAPVPVTQPVAAPAVVPTATKVIVIPNAQPSTVVEAAPMSESKAQKIRKSRQSEELRTEQIIAEKLEEERLREEQDRVNRLFGKKAEVKAVEPVQVAPSTSVESTAPQAAPIRDYKFNNLITDKAVITEKLEIIQPSAAPVTQLQAPAAAAAVAPAPSADASTASTSGFDFRRLQYGTFVAIPSYRASNIRTNYGLGVSVSTMIATDWSLEGTFMYSNYFVDTFWRYGLFTEMNQYDLGGTAKYFWQFGSIRPYAGVASNIVFRTYQDRVKQGTYWTANPNTDSESTYTMTLGVVAGAEVQLTPSIVVNAGLEYMHPIMNQNNFDYSSFSMAPGDSQAIEEFDYMIFKIGGRLSF